MISVFCFLGAVLFICIAHVIRVLRWELFINVYEKPNRRRLIQALSIGYFLNYIVPFKLGDIVRALFAGRKMKNGRSLGLSTVIVDRYLDIVCVGVIFVLLSITGKSKWGPDMQRTALFYLFLAISVLALMVAIYVCKGIVKRVIRMVAGIFNEKIEAGLLQFSWALIWNFKDIFQKIRKAKLLGTTVAMWLCYLLSYFLFACFLSTNGIGTTWVDVFTLLFAQNGIKESTSVAFALVNDKLVPYSIYMVCYMLLPLIVLSLMPFMMKDTKEDEESENYLNLLPHMDSKERLNFLEGYFSDQNRDYTKNYLKINQNISIIRDYSAGSNATTMLCTDGKRTFFRKYAFGDDGEKLYQQIRWICDNQEYLPLPDILNSDKEASYCYYDMLYRSNAVGLFEYAHSMPIEQSWEIIQKVLETLENSIYQMHVKKADTETIHKYIQTKVRKNLEKIKNAKRLKGLQQYDILIINGIEYKNLKFYEKYLEEKYLENIFKNDSYAVIHGDLTIENIICTRNEKGQDDFYIIDPNTGNVHDSPNLDYGKLLQSIHGGYEFLMSTKSVKVSENKINFLFTKSSAYIELHERLRKYMKNQLGDERTRSIYFHEIIHWLRLMPYKIDKAGKRAVLFYAGMLMVMNDVIEMYGDREDS
ncbi:lysylphosphatidylglycerol synthase transmembrane domain-containing protein [Clostridium sp. CAG:43]|uniref:lysylphosphatidylglycerol synthase transmembrane domain-containing protein n=1 Tax=Clostridium sp. CAG:43 TaxID=1262805 RepID=UPI00033F62D7|nr:lysylphosphatidylglycerol synthase transmembrane domain-containing protein [Clostridium sp. CAG:43]CDD58925.1 uncharacterised protein family (UPF0104) [Clostridium sp. CAG:43]